MVFHPDYHMHTPLCRHAQGEPVELAAQAVKLGLSEIGFSDHSPMARDDFDDWRMRADQLTEYVTAVERARKAFPQLTIKLALEVDYLPGQEDWIRHLATLYPWDYFIGSVHYVSAPGATPSPSGQRSSEAKVPPSPLGEGWGEGDSNPSETSGKVFGEGNSSRSPSGEGNFVQSALGQLPSEGSHPLPLGEGRGEGNSPSSPAYQTEGNLPKTWAIDNPHTLAEWKHRDPFEVWSAYFKRLTMAINSGLFEIVGHADLCKKFCYYPKEDCTPLFEEFLDAAKSKNVAMELNTAGLRKDCKEIYPSRQIVEMAFRKGVPITFGSDAHAPGEVGLNFAEAIQLARRVGYTKSRVFHRRQSLDLSL